MIIRRTSSVGTLITLLACGAISIAACSSTTTDGQAMSAGGAGTTVITGSGGAGGTTAMGSAGVVTSGGMSGMITTGGTTTGGQPGGGGTVGDGGATTGGTGGAGTGGIGGAATGGTGGGAGGTVAAGGMGTSGPSAGCTKLPPDTEMFGQATLKMIDIAGMDPKFTAGYAHRKYCTTMPSTYDGTTPLPVVFYGPGCGATGCEGSSFNGHDDVFVVQAIASADAHNGNEVPPGAAPGCFAAGVVGTADSPEGPYFDQVMAEVAATYCIDQGRIFAAGTSSGAWLSNYLACARGNVIRGTAADSGGLQFDHGTCTGGAAVMEFPGDSTNKTQDGHEIGSGLARDMFVTLNGCSTTPTSMQIGNDTCDVYGGCASPVVWCDVGGGHQSGNNHLYPTGMAFWNTLQ